MVKTVEHQQGFNWGFKLHLKNKLVGLYWNYRVSNVDVKLIKTRMGFYG